MSDLINNFHFIRPLWLFAWIPLGFITVKFLRTKASATGLDDVITSELLPFLVVNNKAQAPSSRLPLLLATSLAAIIILALAGPAWKQLPQTVFQNNSALIIALDLSPSMRAQDNAPSRIRRAQLKIQALLERRKEGLTALLVYAGEAHMVTPFTDDTNTINNLLTTLVPGLLPIPGSNTEMAIQLATNQLDNSGLSKASLLLVTDGVDESALATINNQWDDRLSLTILGLGTDAGATIPTNDGYLRDSRGEFILVKRNSDTLQTLASTNNGYYLPLQADDSDIAFIERIITRDFSALKDNEAAQQDLSYDQWYEFGPTLLLFVLPFLALIFRRGWLLCLCLSGPFLLVNPQTAQASLWESLWHTKDQQGHQAWKAEDYEKAESLFNDEKWKASAAYKNNNFNTALDTFKKDTSANGYFNQGNALANLGQIDEAINAYEQALQRNPDFKAAQDNKRYLEDQQNNEQQSNNEQNNDQPSNDNNQENQEAGKNKEQADNTQNSSQNEQNSDAHSDEKSDTEESDTEESSPEQGAGNDEEHDQNDNANATTGEIPLPENLTQEEEQAMQQWLRKIPDDPSGLLRRKFEYEFNKRRQLYQQGKWDLPNNNAHQRY